MRILIDSTQIPLDRTGVGIYAEQLIQNLASVLNSRDELFVLVQDDDISLRKLIEAHDNLFPLFISSSIFRNRLMLALYEQFAMPCVLLKHRINIVHSLHYTFPLLCPCPRIVTIHDLTYFLWPQMHTVARRVVISRFLRLSLSHAEGVLFVSNSTRKDAERLFGPGHNFREVTPLAVDHPAFDAIELDSISRTLSSLGIESPYILFVGTLEPRKNLIRLIQAFNLLGPQHSKYSLVIVGKKGWGYDPILEAIERSPQKARIRRLGYVVAEDKIRLIAGCALLVYPSLYEGFGLPVLEGMAAGVPVITSDTSSLPEVTGTAAVHIDPSSFEQIAAAMDSVLSNTKYADELRQAGVKQARKFSWEQTARLTYAAYADVVAGRKGDCDEPR